MPSDVFVTSVADAGQRLDVLLARRTGLGRAAVKRLLGAGGVRVEGRVAKEKDKGLLVSAGWRIEVMAGDPTQVIARPDLALSVLGEGREWAIVDKPAGMAVHPLEPGESDTVLNAAVARWPEIAGVGEGGLRSGVVHRLDVETSGTLLLARTQEAWERLRAAFSEHRTTKIYRAIVAGEMRGDGEAEMDLVVWQHRPARVRVVEQAPLPPGTRRCFLSWQAVEKLRGATLVEVRLGTGFLHQIRVMLGHLGHPVLGDSLYGGAEAAAMAPRQMLHACRLEVDEARASSPDPADFASVLAKLR